MVDADFTHLCVTEAYENLDGFFRKTSQNPSDNYSRYRHLHTAIGDLFRVAPDGVEEVEEARKIVSGIVDKPDSQDPAIQEAYVDYTFQLQLLEERRKKQKSPK